MDVPVDRGWAWLIAFAVFGVNVAVTSVSKCFSILLLDFQLRFHCSAWEITAVQGTMMAIWVGLAPVSNALAIRFSCRVVICAGGVIGTLGYLGSSVAPSLPWFLVSHGIITGTGCGLMYSPALAILVYYFRQRLGVATSLSMAGVGVAAVVIPFFIRFLVTTYGLQGSMLLQGSAMLHVSVLAMLIRPPSFYTKRGQHLDVCMVDNPGNLNSESKCLKQPDPTVQLESESLILPNKDDTVCEQENNILYVEHNRDKSTTVTLLTQENYFTVQTDNLMSPLLDNEDDIRNQTTTVRNEDTDSITLSTSNTDQSYSKVKKTAEVKLQLDNISIENNEVIIENQNKTTSTSNVEDKLQNIPRTSYNWRHYFDLSLLSHPSFLIYFIGILLTNVAWDMMYFLVPVLATARGNTLEAVGYITSMLGGSDLTGRLFMGWFSDLNFVPRRYILTVCLFGGVVMSTVIPFTTSYTALALTTVIHGLVGGFAQPLTTIVFVDVVGVEKIFSAYGILYLFQAISTLIASQIAGSLRDMTQSWNPSFWFVSALYTVGSLITASDFFLQKYRKHSS